MSKISITPNAAGTGTFTITSPATNTDRTLTLPDAGGSVVMNEGSGTFKIDSSGNVGIGTSSPATALDVTGTITADGLTVDSKLATVSSSATDYTALSLTNLSTNGKNYYLSSAGLGGYYNIPAGGFGIRDLTDSATRFAIASNGSISFYEDTGTTPKFHWDASAESLGVGTSSPAATLDVRLASDRGLYVEGSTSNPVYLRSYHGSSSSNLREIGLKGSDIRFETGLSAGTSTTERARIDSSGNLLVGTTSQYGSQKLSLNGGIAIDGRSAATPGLSEKGDDNTGVFWPAADSLGFSTGGTERLRLDSSGNLLVGKTTSALATAGTALRGDNAGLINSARAGTILELNRLSTDGSIVDFFKDSTTVGSIGTDVGRPYFVGVSSGVAFGGTQAAIWPTNGSGVLTDNAYDIGSTGVRWDDIYATNGTIQTSDRNEKQDIEALSDAEQRVAVACKGLLRKFRWKDAVAEKGDDARIHFGIIAQDLQDAFTAEGLDAGRYAMFISSTWTDEETGEERSRMGVRYPQLLAFIIAAI